VSWSKPAQDGNQWRRTFLHLSTGVSKVHLNMGKLGFELGDQLQFKYDLEKNTF
jgi:hypothetical protein